MGACLLHRSCLWARTAFPQPSWKLKMVAGSGGGVKAKSGLRRGLYVFRRCEDEAFYAIESIFILMNQPKRGIIPHAQVGVVPLTKVVKK